MARTADGRFYYRGQASGAFVYYDADCDGTGSFGAEWIIDYDEPSTTATRDLDDAQLQGAAEAKSTGQKLPGWIKNMITTAEDLIRPPYGRTHKVMQRRSTLMATVNTGDFLKDDTGNRRFWVIQLPQKQYVDVSMPNFVTKTLEQLGHPHPTKAQHSPHQWI